MKLLKYIKTIVYIAGICMLIICIAMVIQWINQDREQKEIYKIQKLIDMERNGMLVVTDNTTQDESQKVDIENIVENGINSSIVKRAFSDIEMINSSTFKGTYNGETKTFHLIGVADDGNIESVKALLESLTSVAITYKPTKKSVEQIYLWENDDSSTENLINLKIVKLKLCKTSYLINSGVSETPNIEYSNLFVSAAKGN